MLIRRMMRWENWNIDFFGVFLYSHYKINFFSTIFVPSLQISTTLDSV
jgi:hypothetical protein